LLLVAAGISGGTLAATFGAWRPVLLPVTFALLGVAFYLTYRRPGAANAVSGSSAAADACCAPSRAGAEAKSCCPPERGRSRIDRVNKVMLWVTTAIVLAFAFFPNYLGLLVGGSGASPPTDANRFVLKIDGMTCTGCESAVRSSLLKVPGVQEAQVSYEKGEAVVSVTRGVEESSLKKAVGEAGYTLTTVLPWPHGPLQKKE
jgi:copper chaperone CopZ